jgi:hypothetical protein
MTTLDVPRAEWPFFFKEFSRQHRGWLATIHGIEGAVPLTRVPSVPIAAISLERDGSDRAVRVTLGSHISLWIVGPAVVRAQRSDDGSDCALEVEAGDEAFLRVAFGATAKPEELDGIAPAEIAASTMSSVECPLSRLSTRSSPMPGNTLRLRAGKKTHQARKTPRSNEASGLGE